MSLLSLSLRSHLSGLSIQDFSNEHLLLGGCKIGSQSDPLVICEGFQMKYAHALVRYCAQTILALYRLISGFCV